MGKIFIVTDTHFGCRGNSSEFLEHSLEFFEKQFFIDVEQQKPAAIFHLGDLMDSRRNTDNRIAEHVKNRFIKKVKSLGIPFYIIPGNHDTYFTNTNRINTIELMVPEVSPTMHQIHSPKVVNIEGVEFLFVPWICPENEQECADALTKDYDINPIVCGHFELNGFVITQGQLMDHGMGREILNKFPAVWSGHFHIRQRDKNITYIGTPYQITFGDLDSPHGYGVFDLDAYKKTKDAQSALTFVENPRTMFDRIVYDDSTSVPVFDPELYKGKTIKILVQSQKNTPEFEKFIASVSKTAASVSLIESQKTPDIQGTVNKTAMGESIDTPQMIISVIDNLLYDTDTKSDLKRFLLEIHTDALSREKK